MRLCPLNPQCFFATILTKQSDLTADTDMPGPLKRPEDSLRALTDKLRHFKATSAQKLSLIAHAPVCVNDQQV